MSSGGRGWRGGFQSGNGGFYKGGRGGGGGGWRGNGGGGWRPRWRGRWRGGGSGRGKSSSQNEENQTPGGANRRGRFDHELMPPPNPLASLNNSQFFDTSTQNLIEKSSVVHTMAEIRQCPYKGWKLYLPTKSYSEDSDIIAKLKVATKFLEKPEFQNVNIPDLKELSVKKFCSVSINKIMGDSEFTSQWRNFQEDFKADGDLITGILGLALQQVILTKVENPHFPRVKARIVDLEPLTPIKDVKTALYGKTVCVQGTIVRVSNVRPAVAWLAFECVSCGHVQSVYQPSGKFVQPLNCSEKSCRGRRFAPVRSHDRTITVDYQRVKIQELVQHESGRVPRTVSCEFTEDLCDTAVPGDIVRIVAVVKSAIASEAGRVNPNDRAEYHLMLKALSVVNSKGRGSGQGGGSGGNSVAKSSQSRLANNSANAGIEFTAEDFELVREIHSFENLIFKLIVHSLCPSIYGHDLVKAGLILGLFGGTVVDKAGASVRGDPHILVVGDPGLGKSQMLLSCASVAPRGVFVTGNSTTASGLTVTLSRESGNDFSLEAGALVLADQGCCCIDEFDKMSSQHQALLECMEQQAVSIAKSGVVASLPARAAVLAAANPNGGHYNRAKTVSENLKMNPALLSRFDLVFILIDKPDEEMDNLLSNHIMNLHKMGTPCRNDSLTSSLNNSNESGSGSGTTLLERLRKRPNERIDPISHDLLRKYIAYARQYVHPKLSPGAANILKEFYVELRQRHKSDNDYTPITLRQLESLKRLTEARAKIECREEATEEDALDVIEIMKTSMVDIFSDERGGMDFSRALNGSGTSSRGAAKKFISALHRHAQSLGRCEFHVDEMKQILASIGKTVPNFFDFIESLNTQGLLLKKASKMYKLLTSDF